MLQRSTLAGARVTAIFALGLAALTAHPMMSRGSVQRPIADLAGRWAGAGTVQWKNGRETPYKCTVTYFLTDNNTRVKQTLRCQGTDETKLEIATLMQVSGEAITGTWEERLSAMTGTVKGKVTANGYEALAHNQFFNAAFEIAMASACEQQVTIRPSRDIALITANLRKC
jgi:hypothetical protein